MIENDKIIIDNTTVFTGIESVKLCDKKLNEIVLDCKNNVVLFTSSGQLKRGTPFNCTEFAKIIVCQPNPDLDFLDNVISELKRIRPSYIIAFGGGSVIDSAKVASVFLFSDISLNEYFRNIHCKKTIFSKRCHLICIPTTSGTGAEITPFATVWDRKNEVKRSFACNLLEPDFIYLDPMVTLTAPKELTIFCAMDACSHALESLWNKNMTDISFKYAIESLKLISCNLMPLLNDLNNVCYRAKIQLSSFYSGCAIRITRTAIAHSISYPITLKYNVPHGLACSFTLKKIIDCVTKNQLWNKQIPTDLIENISNLISAIDLDSYLKQYCSKSDIINLIDKMNTVGRADNFIVDNFKLRDLL